MMRRPMRWLASITLFAVLLYNLRSSAIYHLEFHRGSPPKHPHTHPHVDLYNYRIDDQQPQQPLGGDTSRTPSAPASAAREARPSATRPPLSDDAAPTDVGSLWAKWSRAMLEARPKCPAVKLQGLANTVVPNLDRVRTPTLDIAQLSDEDLRALRDAHARFVGALERSGSRKQRAGESTGEGNDVGDERSRGNLILDDSHVFRGGRGIVTVGGGEFFGPAIIGLHMLRLAGSKLPVEVFLPNEDEYETGVCESYLPKLGAECVVLSRILSKGATIPELTSYQLKAFALLLSSFSEVILLDSDSIPLVAPETSIFSREPYTSHGMVGWPDYWQATESPRFWTIAGLPRFPENLPPTASESGQVVINKKTHLAPLLLATYYNLYGRDHFYPLLSQGALGQGDKETFMAAAVALNATYYRVQTPVARMERFDGSHDRGTAMVQHLPSDDLARAADANATVRPAFLHSNTPKMNAGHLVDEGDLLSVDGKRRLRLLGSRARQEAVFGFDVESTLWDLLVQTGCELASSIREWAKRDRLCERIREHHDLVFGED